MAKSKKTSTNLFPKELTTVTPVSRALAFVVVLALPIIAFFWGMNYQSMLNGSYCSQNMSLVQPIHMDYANVTPAMGR